MEQNNIPPQPPMQPTGPVASNNKICSVLAYLVIGIIWYFLDEEMKKDNSVKFHVKQGLVLLGASIAVQIVGTLIPILGWFIIMPLGNLLVLVLLIIGIANALSGKNKELPLIGHIGTKFNF